MEWWVLELITVTVMFALIAILGPLIKRYGKSYAADVFRVNPRTGKSYLVLMDFAYYLIFGAYILFSIKWEPDTGWDQQVNAEQLQADPVRSCRRSQSTGHVVENVHKQRHRSSPSSGTHGRLRRATTAARGLGHSRTERRRTWAADEATSTEAIVHSWP